MGFFNGIFENAAKKMEQENGQMLDEYYASSVESYRIKLLVFEDLDDLCSNGKTFDIKTYNDLKMLYNSVTADRLFEEFDRLHEIDESGNIHINSERYAIWKQLA